jgi:L-rhamnose mutarotase
MLVKGVFQDQQSLKWAFVEYSTDSSGIFYNIGNKEFDSFEEAEVWRNEYYEKTKQVAKSVKDVLRERAEHKYSISQDKTNNSKFQLLDAAKKLLFSEFKDTNANYEPYNWDSKVWNKMLNKEYRERLVISASLILAEIDRIDE